MLRYFSIIFLFILTSNSNAEIKNKITKENKDNFDSKIENFTNELISKIFFSSLLSLDEESKR